MSADVTRKLVVPPAFNSALGLGGWLLLCFAVAGIGGAATSSSVGTWYQELQKPSWNPPSWVFGPVWTALYAMMAVAAWLVWRQPRTNERSGALWAFGAQLGLNLLWSCLFFGLRSPGWALVEIAVLWMAIAFTIGLFRRLSRPAALLMAPYLAWVSFATVLNFTIWTLNR